MKIIQHKNWAGSECEVSISDAIEGSIDDNSGGGLAEIANDKANKAGEILGKLIPALHKRNMLTDSEVVDILGWRYRVEE